MPNGTSPAQWDEGDPGDRPKDAAEDAEAAAAARAAVRRWRAAVRWRRRLDAKLELLGLTLPRWLVLESTRELVRESGDAVSQAAVAERAGLDKNTVSEAMQALEKLGFVSRGPDMTWPAYRIFVTARGVNAALEGRARIDATGWES